MILDTNALSAMADGDPKLEVAVVRAEELEIPVIVLGEYQYGIAQSRNKDRYQRWLKELIAACRVLNVDESTAKQYALVLAELKHDGRPIPSNDAWISALARQHALPVLSRDEHFDLVRELTRVSW